MLAEGASPPDGSSLATVVPGVLRDASIVVVDDKAENVALLDRVLRGAGVREVRGFTDPRDALEACKREAPDLVMADLHMPHLDGVSLIDELRDALPPRAFLPVVVLTADVTPEARQRALHAGAKDFLTKPLDVTEVVLRTRNLLETKALHRELEEHNQSLRAELEAQAAVERAAHAARERRLARVESALTPGALSIVFQPIVDITTGDVVGAEALTRFSLEPTQPPNVWFAEAADVGRGVELELVAVSAALDGLARLHGDVFLSANASPATAMSDELVELLGRHDAARVVIELTEHDRVPDYDALVARLGSLRALGSRVAVDDTGAGYASLEHLLRLSADILKLDIALTRGIDHDPVRRSLAAALVAFAADVGSIIIAEGVETAEELRALRDLGVEWAQGYHLARPAPLPIARAVVVT